MLTRLATEAARSWLFPCCQRVSVRNGPRLILWRHYASEPLSGGNLASLYRSIERRLKTVKSTLGYSDTPKPLSLDELEAWKDAVQAEDFDMALRKCGERLLLAPAWVILYLFAIKVRTPAQAVAGVNVMLRLFAKADKKLQPALILLTIRFLAWQKVESPVPKLFKLFLVLELTDPSTQFNILLRNMSRFKPSPVLAKVTAQIIDVMHGRRIKLHARTYRTLLSNSFVTVELAKKLQYTMEAQGTTPNRRHLEAYLRVFAHHGAVHSSSRYLNLMREDYLEKGGGIVPHGVEFSSRVPRAVKTENSANARFNTEFLMSLKKRTGSAFQYLRDMVEEENAAPSILQMARKGSRIGRPRRKNGPRILKHRINVTDWTTVLNSAAHNRNISGERLLWLFDEVRAKSKFPLTVANFTVLMRGLAKKGDYATALEVWERCCASWTRRRKIDTRALTVAVQVMAANGYHRAAFDTLIETTGVLLDGQKPPKKLDNTAIGRRRKRALYSRFAKVDVAMVNALMDAYQENGRPDLVFELWDVFIPLFGVHPNSDTLTVVLDAAYSVSRWDRTFRGLLEQLGLHDLFSSTRSHRFEIEGKTRWQIVQHMQWLIHKGAISPSPSSSDSTPTTKATRKEVEKERMEAYVEAKKLVRKTLWNGDLASHKAVELFQEILLGNYPQLKDVVPPVKAVWPDEASNASPMRDALGSLGSRLRGGSSAGGDNPPPKAEPSQSQGSRPFLLGPVFSPSRQQTTSTSTSSSSSPFSSSQSPTTSSLPPSPPSLADIFPLPTSVHPQITPTAKTFASYIHLLSSLNRASQIPLTLAWMRCLHIRPLKRSLAIAVALWSEASMRGPLIEQFYGAQESEFGKMRRWLEEWLGRGGMPSTTAISWAFRKLKEEREK